MTDLPRTRRASYEQGWETGYQRGEASVIEDITPHIEVVYGEMKNNWIPAEVRESLLHLLNIVRNP